MKIHQLLEMPIEPTGDPNDPTVYGHERANPMSLKGRIQQARNQLQELAKASESDDLVVWESICKKAKGGMFMGLEQNLEQIRHGIEELAQRRRKGGSNARGIDKGIGEAKGPAQQAAIAIAMKKTGKKPKGVAENVAGDVNSKKRYHFLYPHVPLDMHTDHEYNDLSDRDLQAVKSHQRELADKLGKPGAEKQSDIASHIQINRARSEYDQEQAHRRKVLDAEKIKRQARDAKRQQGVAEGNDPNKLAASVTVDGELKEFDLTPFIVKNNWVGDPKTVIKQADKWLGDFLRSKGLAYSNLKISYKGMVMNASQTGDADVPMPEFESSELLGRYKKATKKQFDNDEKGMAEGAAETVPMQYAQKVLNHYGADYFKTTHDTLYFSKYRKQFSIGRIRDDDSASAGSVNLSDLNDIVRKLRDMRVPLSPFGEGVAEGWKEKLGAATVAGAMALGAGGASADTRRVTPDGQGGFTGGWKPTSTQQSTDTAPTQSPASTTQHLSLPIPAAQAQYDNATKLLTYKGKQYKWDLDAQSTGQGEVVSAPSLAVGSRSMGPTNVELNPNGTYNRAPVNEATHHLKRGVAEGWK